METSGQASVQDRPQAEIAVVNASLNYLAEGDAEAGQL
jgi:hypothetical protein